MASTQPGFRDGGSGNKPTCFVGEHYDYWKIHMQAFLETQREEIWDAVENGSFIPTTITNNVVEIKEKASWTDDDKKKVLFDKKAKNLLQSTLGMDEFLH
jgi:CO dehydrogenase/acetyl-CoA synthase alpha subunit